MQNYNLVIQMKNFNNIEDYITNSQNFIIPFDIRPEVYLLRKIEDSEYWINEFILEQIKTKYPDISKVNASKIKDLILEELNKTENYIILKNQKIIYKCSEVPENMFECDECGNIWDGCAQCNCYLDY